MCMNRELKFRAWDWDRKKMYLKPTVSDGSDGGSTACVYLNAAIACHDETLMQFTGLLDSNGKEIYEGDLLHILDGHGVIIQNELSESIPFEVAFEGCEYILLNPDKSKLDRLSSIQERSWECQVIGNIYEKPKDLN